MANSSSRPITNADIYDRLDAQRKELTRLIQDSSREHKSELTDLRRQFETLEAGRLTRLEGKYQDLQVQFIKLSSIDSENNAVVSKQMAIIGVVTIIILTGISQAIWLRIFK
jgi:hypothetical protein